MLNSLYTQNIKRPALYRSLRKSFTKLLSPEEYLLNYRNSKQKEDVEIAELHPMIEANHEPNHTKIRLFSIPHAKLNRISPLLLDALTKYSPDLIVLQAEPMPYITRQRFMSHKAALHEVEDYSVKAIPSLDSPRPFSWEECVVDLLVLDMSLANQIHTNLDYTKGFITFSYNTLQQEVVTANLEDKFIKAITDYVVADHWSPYHEINSILYTSLMSKHRVLLGDMPEILLRQILGNTLRVEQVRDMFRIVLKRIERTIKRDEEILLDLNIQDRGLFMKNVTLQVFSHVFLAPKDLYLAALLKKAAIVAFSICAFVGSPHFLPVQKYWVPPPHGVNFTQACRIPDRLGNETNDDLIEKQAIFDVLLGTRVWAGRYLMNPFPYIDEDITKLKDLERLKQTFYLNVKKYEMFRDRVIDDLLMKQLEYREGRRDIEGKKELNKLT